MNAPLLGKNLSLEAPPELKVIQTKDATGRIITTFAGHPSTWMREFSSEPRRARSIRTKRNG